MKLSYILGINIECKDTAKPLSMPMVPIGTIKKNQKVIIAYILLMSPFSMKYLTLLNCKVHDKVDICLCHILEVHIHQNNTSYCIAVLQLVLYDKD